MSNTSNSGGIGFMGMLFILFLGLKLTGFIAWSWWWVTAPLWGLVLMILVVFSIAFCVAMISQPKRRRF